jgi:hypothetical protein
MDHSQHERIMFGYGVQRYKAGQRKCKAAQAQGMMYMHT